MSVVYQEITNPLLIPECVSFQKSVFGLSDIDLFPASFYSLLIRKEHPLGMLVGCFKKSENSSQLIGLVVLQEDNHPNSLYCLYLAVLPMFQNKLYGLNLSKKARELALQKGYNTMFGIYDPLEVNLGKLYAHLGVTAPKYIYKPYKLDTKEVISIDKVLFKWDLTNNSLNHNQYKISYKEAVNKYKIVSDTNNTDESFLLEVPNNYSKLITDNLENAQTWRINTQRLFDYYLNKENYSIVNCISGKTDNAKKAYYILSKN